MFVFSDETADATPYYIYIYACLIIYLNYIYDYYLSDYKYFIRKHQTGSGIPGR